jgi:hypothetical protein
VAKVINILDVPFPIIFSVGEWMIQQGIKKEVLCWKLDDQQEIVFRLKFGDINEHENT